MVLPHDHKTKDLNDQLSSILLASCLQIGSRTVLPLTVILLKDQMKVKRGVDTLINKYTEDEVSSTFPHMTKCAYSASHHFSINQSFLLNMKFQVSRCHNCVDTVRKKFLLFSLPYDLLLCFVAPHLSSCNHITICQQYKLFKNQIIWNSVEHVNIALYL